MTYPCLALVLNQQAYHEYDRLYDFYTLEYGWRRIRARGISKMTSRLVSQIEPGSVVECLIAEGKGYDLLAQAKQISAPCRDSLESLLLEQSLLQAVSLVSTGSQANPELYHLLVNSLAIINDSQKTFLNSTECSSLVFYLNFWWQLLAVTGYQPVTDNCTASGQELIKGVKLFWSHQLGGVYQAENLEYPPTDTQVLNPKLLPLLVQVTQTTISSVDQEICSKFSGLQDLWKLLKGYIQSTFGVILKPQLGF